jgi:hypothetical protein
LVAVLRTTMETMRFWELSPVDTSGEEYGSLISQAPGGPAPGNRQVLCKPGSRYIVYTWGEPSDRELRIDLPPGSYDYRWIDASDGGEYASGQIDGGGVRLIESPRAASWKGESGTVLLIFHTDLLRSLSCTR